jgi:hypothetical protein
MTGSKDAYAQYGSPQEFTDKYAGLIQRRYTGAVGAGDDMGKFAAALSGGGYATDPDYANKLQAAYKTVRAAGGGMQPVAQDTLAATTAGPGAMNPRRVRGPLDNPVQIIDMPSGQVSMAFPRSDNPSAGMTQDDYTAARAALRQNPGLAQRMQVTANGLMVDGVPMPANVLLGGDAEIAKFKKNAAQAQRVAVNPLEGRLAEEALRGEVANRGHQIAADASLGVADKNAASAEKVAKIQTEASLLQHRYLPAGGEVDEMGRKKPTVYYDTQPTLPPGKYVPLPQNVPAKAVAIQQAREALKRGGKLEDVNAILQGYGYEPITQ